MCATKLNKPLMVFCNLRVTATLRESLERELLHLEQLGIYALQKVNHSEWATPVVVIPKGRWLLKSVW